MRTLPLLLLLLAGCDAPNAAPQLMSATASCDEADGSWHLEALAEHDEGADAIESVIFDLFILFVSDELTDTQYIGTHYLEHEGAGVWARDVALLDTTLECGFDGLYLLTVTAEDDDGNQAAGQIRIDGLGNFVSR